MAVLVAATGAIHGCTATSETQDSPAPAPSLHGAAAERASALLLSPAELPRLRGEVAQLSAGHLAEESGDQDLVPRLEAAGYVGGLARDLRGRSRDITGADSRVMVFTDPDGATWFADTVAQDADAFFGEPSAVRPVEIGSRSGYLIKPPLCDCPGAYPVYAGVLATADAVLWLQVTGPRASASDVRNLLSAAG